MAVLIFLGFWVLVFEPCSSESTQMNSTEGGNGTEEMNMTEGNTASDLEEVCSGPDVYTLHIHLVNVLIVLLDLCISRIPIQFFHIFYVALFTLPYALFTIIYWGAGGTDSEGNSYIYSALNYEESRISTLLAFALIPGGFLTFLIIFLLAWLRDAVYYHIRFCFRDVHNLPYQEEIEIQEKQEKHKEKMQEANLVV